MVFLVLDNVEHLDDVLAAWHDLGINGATIIESTGLHRRHRVHMPMRYALGSAMLEEGNYAVFSIVPDEAAARQCLEAVERVVGDLENPNTGIMAAWPLGFVKGLPN